MPSNLKPHHSAWLSAHPERDEAWLRERLSDGFDVHHGDGDHSNNAPGNLFLIEHRDHMRLHGAPAGLRSFEDMLSVGRLRRKIRRGLRAYQLRCSGMIWAEVDKKVGGNAMWLAKFYAQSSGLPWPMKVKVRRPPPPNYFPASWQ